MRDESRICRGSRPRRGARPPSAVIVTLAALLLAGCAGGQTAADARYQPVPIKPGDVPGGNPRQGQQAIQWTYGCGACHVIPGVTGATGQVGPPLTDWARRVYIAGNLANTPDNLVLWIREPQRVEPGTAMPDLGVTEADARDIAAYLYTLR